MATSDAWTMGSPRTYDGFLGPPILFNPRKRHETGDRVVITCTPRTSKLSAEDRREEPRFNLPVEDVTPEKEGKPMLQKEYILDEDEALGALLRVNEFQQQVMDEMIGRSALLQDVVEEEGGRKIEGPTSNSTRTFDVWKVPSRYTGKSCRCWIP